MSGGGIIHVYHLYTKNKSEKRLDEEIINRIRVMPFISAIIENRDKEKTAVVSIRENKFNPQNKDYELISKVNVHGEERFVSVILTDSDRYFRDKQKMLYLSVFTESLNKSAEPFVDRRLSKSAIMPLWRISLPVIETDKIPRASASLINIERPEPKPFQTYSALQENNHKYHIPESGESQALLKGKTEKNREKPAYRMLEDVQNGLNSHFAATLNVVYKTICRYLGLPEVFENVLKARKEDEDEPLILNGRVIFSPETGES